MKPEHEKIIGYLFIAYGSVKLILMCLNYVLSYDKREVVQDIPFINMLITTDLSFVGNLYLLINMAFSIFTIFLGLLFVHDAQHHFPRNMQYVAYYSTGALLVLVYLIARYSSVPVPKNDNHMLQYKFYGLYGGILMIVAPIMFDMAMRIFAPATSKRDREEYSLLVYLVLSGGIILLASMLYNYITETRQHSIQRKMTQK